MRNLIFSAVEDAFRPYLARVLARSNSLSLRVLLRDSGFVQHCAQAWRKNPRKAESLVGRQ